MRRDILLTIATRFAKILAGIGVAIITARALGDAGRGEYFLIVTVALTVAQFGNLGLHSSNTYEVARDRTLLAPLFANSLWLSLGVGVGLALLTVGASSVFGWFSTTSTGSLLIIVLLAPAVLFVLLASNLLVGMSRITTFNMFEFATTLLLLVGLLIAALTGLGAHGFIVTTATCWALAAFALFLVLRRDVTDLAFRSDVLRAGIEYSFRAYIIALLAFLVLRGNVFVLDRIAGVEELGRFSVALQVVDVLVIIPSSIALVVFPDLVREKAGRWDRVVRGLAPVAALAGGTSLLAGLVARPVFKAMFGIEFSDAAPMLWWMLPGVFCLSLATLLSQYLAAIGIPTSVVVVWILTLAIVISGGFALIPEHGGVGAGAALSIGYTFLAIALWVVGWRHNRRTAGDASAILGGGA